MSFNEQKERAKLSFKDFKATVILDNDDFLIMDWKKDGDGILATRYILDKEKGDLIINGDAGNAIAGWYNEVTPEKINSFVKDVGYFTSKIRCSTDLYTYRAEDIKKDLKEFIERCLEEDGRTGDFYKEDIDQDIDRLTDLIEDRESPYLSEEAEDILRKYTTDPFGHHFGERISQRVYLWSVGYQMAFHNCMERGLLHDGKRDELSAVINEEPIPAEELRAYSQLPENKQERGPANLGETTR